MEQEWIAAYYPSDLIEDQRLKGVYCLLFDRVIFHFPIAGMFCGGGAGVSDFFSDDPLVEEGVLDLREEYLLEEVEVDFSDGHPWGTDEEFKLYHDLNVAGMALHCCEEEDAIPVTSRCDAPIPVSLLPLMDVSRSASIQASALAIESLDFALPSFATMESYDVLEARAALRDQLGPFRSAMYRLAPTVRAAMNESAGMGELHVEAKYIVETDILPALAELERRLRLERKALWRRVLGKVGSPMLSIAMKWVTGGAAAAAVDAARVAGGLASQALTNHALAENVLALGGLGFLLEASSKLADTPEW